MIVLFDTSVLVACFIESHPQHKTVMPWLKKVNQGEISLVVSTHSLAECYAVLTKLPIVPKILPSVAYHLISENITKLAKIISLTGKDYLSIILNLSKLGLSGGITYDAILLKAAEKAQAEHLLTLNARDFQRLCPGNKAYIIEPIK